MAHVVGRHPVVAEDFDAEGSHVADELLDVGDLLVPAWKVVHNFVVRHEALDDVDSQSKGADTRDSG